MSGITQYRLENPRKLFRAVAVLALATSFSVAGITGSLATGQQPEQLEFITVEAGDSLWSLASELAPKDDPRDWIADVVAINALDSIDLEPGQQIALPR